MESKHDVKVHEQKLKDIQKYIPFLKKLIEQFKASKKETNLNKVQQLYNLITSKKK